MDNDAVNGFRLGSIDINAIREAVVAQEFANNVGRRAFILISSYPFMIIGEVIGVISDYLAMKVEVTNVAELDNEEFRIHIDDIEVFYIETDGKEIPDIRDVHL